MSGCVWKSADVAIISMLIKEIAENLWISKDWNVKSVRQKFSPNIQTENNLSSG